MVALKVFIVVFLVLLLLLVTPAIGQNQTHPFAPDVIQDDGDGDGYSTCDDPILLVKVQCPVGWELDEEEDSISFNNASDYTYIIIERQHIFPIDNTADYMRDFLNSQRENGRVEIIDMSETSINGKEAHSSEYTSGGGSFKTIAYFVIDTGEYLGYIIRLISNPEAFDKYVPTFERIATSFEITDTKSEVPEPPGEIIREPTPFE